MKYQDFTHLMGSGGEWQLKLLIMTCIILHGLSFISKEGILSM